MGLRADVEIWDSPLLDSESPDGTGSSLIGEGGCVVTVCVAGYLVLVKAVGIHI